MLLEAGPRLHASEFSNAHAAGRLAPEALPHSQKVIIRLVDNALNDFVREIHFAGGYRA